MRLGDWPLPYVRVACAECEREGRLNKDGLIDRFGQDTQMYVVRAKLTAANCQRPNKELPCLSILPDALLVHAIVNPHEAEVLRPSLIPVAKEWREKLGMD
jgi:hypothetical protein